MLNSRQWYRVHKYIGIYCSAFVLIIAFTGLVLTFSEVLSLQKKTAPFISSESVDLSGIQVGLKGEYLTVNRKETKVLCHSPIVGMSRLNPNKEFPQSSLLVACQNVIYWLSEEGFVISSVNVTQDISPVDSVYLNNDRVYVEYNNNILRWDLNSSKFDVLDTQPQQELIKLQRFEEHVLSLDQWLLKLHTGLLLGDLGRWLSRIAALGLIMLCVTGLKNAIRK
jgi:hypothetical protein